MEVSTAVSACIEFLQDFIREFKDKVDWKSQQPFRLVLSFYSMNHWDKYREMTWKSQQPLGLALSFYEIESDNHELDNDESQQPLGLALSFYSRSRFGSWSKFLTSQQPLGLALSFYFP